MKFSMFSQPPTQTPRKRTARPDRIDELRPPRLQGTGADTAIRVAHWCPSRNHCWPRPLSGWLHAMKPGQWCQRQLGLARLLWRRQVHPRCDECCSFHEGVDRQFWSMETVLDLHSAPSPLPARDWGDLGNPVARRRRSAEDRLFRVGGFLQAAAEHACFEVVLDVGDGGRHVSEGDDGAGRGVGVVPGFSPRYRMRRGSRRRRRRRRRGLTLQRARHRQSCSATTRATHLVARCGSG